MYNQSNLPLSKTKIIKKTLNDLPPIIFFVIGISFLLIMPLVFRQDNLDNLTSGYIFQVAFRIVMVFIVVFLIDLFYQYLYYRAYSYEFRDGDASISKGVVSRSTGHVNYDRLQNIYVDQDFLDRIFGLYDVHYETAGEKSAFYSHVDGLKKENADRLVEFLTNRNKPNSTQRPIEEKLDMDMKENITEDDQRVITIKDCPLLQSYVWISALKISFWLSIFSAFFLIAGCRTNDTFGSIIIFTSFLIYWITIFILLFIVTFIYMSIWYKNFSYKLDFEKGEIRSKVIGESVSYFNYDRLQNINVTQGIIERFFGMYHIYIETAGEASSLRLSIPALNKENSEKIRNFLLEKISKYKVKL